MKTFSLRVKLHLAIIIIVSVIIGMFVLGRFGFNTLSGLRAYVGGEGLWAKNQKDACYQLIQYAYSKDEIKYRAFLESLVVPLGDKQARLELEKNNPDDEIVFQGFLKGGNHPDDISQMTVLYKRFKNTEHIHNAIEQWMLGDLLLEELMTAGEDLHLHISTDNINQVYLDEIVARIGNLQVQLTNAENRFSYYMGLASRWAADLLYKVMIAFTLVGTVICLAVLIFVGEIIFKLQRYGDELKETAKVEQEMKKELIQERDKLQDALAEIKTLQGILPICSHCKSIRDDQGAWNQMESYIRERSDADFSHGICPRCAIKHYPEVFNKDNV